MKKKPTLRIHILLVLLLLLGVGCVKRTRNIPADQRLLPAKTATREELMQSLEATSAQVQTVKGTMSIALSTGGPKSGVLSEYHETRATIVVERPAHIHVQVQLPIVLTTVANMVSDGRQYRIHFPIQNQYMVGDVDEPPSAKNSVRDLRPQQFLAGLFVDIRPYLANPQQVKATFDEWVEGIHSYYIFSFINFADAEAHTIERIWIDRYDLRIARKQVFGADGRVELDSQYSNYDSVNGVMFPLGVVLELPLQDYTVKMTFQKPVLNETLPENAFELPQPEGAKLLQVAK